MTSVIEQINQKTDRILQKLDDLERRIIDIEITIISVEKEIENKNKSSKRNKKLIQLRNEEPLKLENVSYQKGSFDEWIYNTQLPKIRQELESINNLRNERIKIKENLKESIINKKKKPEEKLKSKEESSSNGESN